MRKGLNDISHAWLETHFNDIWNNLSNKSDFEIANICQIIERIFNVILVNVPLIVTRPISCIVTFKLYKTSQKSLQRGTFEEKKENNGNTKDFCTSLFKFLFCIPRFYVEAVFLWLDWECCPTKYKRSIYKY